MPARADSPPCPTGTQRSTRLKVERHPVLLTLPGKGLKGKNGIVVAG